MTVYLEIRNLNDGVSAIERSFHVHSICTVDRGSRIESIRRFK